MASVFNYEKAGLWFRPIIPITIRHKKHEVGYLALLDSGADFNIFHSDIAKILKINVTKFRKFKFSGIKSGAEGEGSFVELYIGVNHIFFKTLAVFSDDISDNGYGILGQQGFFNHHVIQFDYSKKTIRIR